MILRAPYKLLKTQLNKHSPAKTTKLRISLIVGSVSAFVSVFQVANAQPLVNGNVITVPEDGWYQFQSSETYDSFCQGVSSCTVPDGTYIVINHTTGQRFRNVQVPGDIVNGITVSGNLIQWPNDGWYQVQSETTNASVCEGGLSCEVEPGSYRVINLTTGQRFKNIKVTGDSNPPASGITLTGNTISWPGDDWYQIQSVTDHRSICEGGNSCTVEPGEYHIINHTTGVRIENFIVSGGTNTDQNPTTPVDLRGTVYSATDLEIFWDASTDADGWVVGYDIYRNGIQVETQRDARSYYENSLQPDTNYHYEVVAVDDAGNESDGVSVQLRTKDTTGEPTEPSNTVAAAQAPIVDSNNQVSWAFSPQASDLSLTVEPFVQMPLASNGLPARWNDMETLGNQIFVVDEQDGRIYDITNRQPTLWFDIGDAIELATGRFLNIANPFHGGVRGIAFHPDFANNGKLYTSLLEERPTDTTGHHYLSDAAALDADSVLIEWTVNTSTMVVDPASYREVFRVGIPEYDHPIKQIAFDPSAQEGDHDYGLLYIAHGDGSQESTTTVGGQGNNALGKILRIDPLENGPANYSIPGDNPFVGDNAMLDEVYSIGHRNPHHPAFMKDGTLLVAEDGRDNIDEINLITAGSDFGWSQREGAYVQRNLPGLVSGIGVLPVNDSNNDFVYPVAQFGHTGGVNATFTGQALGGGFVVENGSELDGKYFYIDFPKTGEIYFSDVNALLSANTTGEPEALTVAKTWLASIAYDDDNNVATPPVQTTMNQIIRTSQGYVNTNDRVDIRYGQGPSGELYLFSKRNNMVYLISNSKASDTHGSEVRGIMSSEAQAAAPADCLLSAAPTAAPFYCFSPTDRRLMRIENNGSITWQFSLPGENSSNHIESINFVNGGQVAIIADATPSPDDSAFDMSLFEQSGAYVGTYHIIPDIENPDGVDFAGVNLDGLNLIVRVGPVRQDSNAESGYTSDLYVYGEYYSEIGDADATQLSGWDKQGAFRARLNTRTGDAFDTKLFPGNSAQQALSRCAVPASASVSPDSC